jgi:diaminopimelate decarboxylase
VEYLVRLNALGGVSGGGLRMTGSPSQFGVPVETLTHGTPLLASEGGTRPVGFHVFSATNLAGEAAVLAELRSNVVTAATAVNRTDLVPELVDIGGGFGAPFATPGARPRYPGLRAGLAASLDEHLPGWRSGEPVVAVESGRHVVGGAGELLTTVLDVKVSGGRRFVLCDAGINALGGMSGLGRLLPGNAQPAGQPADAAPVALVGPLCTPLDILSGSARVGNPAVGDVLAIPNVGAYGLTASLVSFLGRPLPAEVVVDGEAVVDARRLALIPLDLAYPAAHA